MLVNRAAAHVRLDDRLKDMLDPERQVAEAPAGRVAAVALPEHPFGGPDLGLQRRGMAQLA